MRRSSFGTKTRASASKVGEACLPAIAAGPSENGTVEPRLRYYRGVGCFSSVGRQFADQEQDVSLGPGCELVSRARGTCRRSAARRTLVVRRRRARDRACARPFPSSAAPRSRQVHKPRHRQHSVQLAQSIQQGKQTVRRRQRRCAAFRSIVTCTYASDVFMSNQNVHSK